MFRRAIAFSIGLVLAASSPALARNDPAPAGMATPPAREGNIYDHKDHQPNQAEVSGAEGAAAIERPSSDSKRKVEEEVNNLLQQTDRLDRQMELQEQGYPSGSSSPPKSNW